MFPISSRQIHIWRETLNDKKYLALAYRHLLSDDERKRAENFKFSRLRDLYIVNKIKQRLILARYLAIEPETIIFGFGGYGKPYISYPVTDISYNASHSASEMIIAISLDGEVGVDIEIIKPLSDLPGLVQSCFAFEEQEYWLKLPERQKLECFYHFWTCKEAWVKAVGCGIGIGVDKCVLNLEKEGSYKRLPENYGSYEQWYYQKLFFGSNLAGVLTVASKDFSLLWYNLEDIR